MIGKILPYKTGSSSAKALSEALGIKRLKLQNSKWKPKADTVIINWGSSEYRCLEGLPVPEGISVSILNSPLDVAVATDKKKFFVKMLEKDNGQADGNLLTPLFWLDAESIPADRYPVVCRTILNGHSGNGIVIADKPDDVVPAPLYVQYVKKKKEFRIHIGKLPDGTYTIIAEQQKVKKSGQDPLDWRIRSHANGFVFQRQGIDVPVSVRPAAIRALEATGLDFGAIDIIYTAEGKAFVLEVNTAPGLEGQTVQDYANFFKEFL
jgi:hypothetical protein